MSHLVTLLLLSICTAILTKRQSAITTSILFITIIAYGALVFPNIDGIAEAIKWRINDAGGVMTYKFIDDTADKDWSNPKQWSHMFSQIHQTYWWLVWPTYFGIVHFIARTLRRSGTDKTC